MTSGGVTTMTENEVTEAFESTTPHPALRALGWVSLGLGVAAVSLYVGRELRKWYRFNHRTPYDFYSHAAAPSNSEFGMGI
jgi:hypothetical protein